MTLLLESNYLLNKKLQNYLRIGINFEKNFKIIVELESKTLKSLIKFNTSEFFKILSEKNCILNFLYYGIISNIHENKLYLNNNLCIKFCNKNGIKTIKIYKKNYMITLDSESILNIIKLEYVIKQKIIYLYTSDLKNKYCLCIQQYVESLKLNKNQTLFVFLENNYICKEKSFMFFMMEALVYCIEFINKDIALIKLYSK